MGGAVATTGHPQYPDQLLYYDSWSGRQVAVAGSHRAGSLTYGPTTLSTTTSNGATYFVAQLSPANQWQWAVGGRAVS